MKKLSIFLALCLFSSFAVRAGEGKGYLAFAGVYALNLGVIGYTTGTPDLPDITTALLSALLVTEFLRFPPKTEKECKIHMGLQVASGGLMLGRIWYKMAHRPRPMPAPGGQRLP